MAGEGCLRAAKMGAKCAPRWGRGLSEKQARHENRAVVGETLPQARRCGAWQQWPQPSAGKMPRSKSAYAVRRGAKMQVRREAVSGQSETVLFARCAPVLGRCSGRRAWFGWVKVAVSRGGQAYRPNPACSGRGYAPGRPARRKFGKTLAVSGFGRHAPPLTPRVSR